MPDNIQRLAHFILFGFVVVAASLFYWQVMRGPELVARGDNPRLVQAELRLRRGRLLDRYGQVLAYSEPLTSSGGVSGIVQRRYPWLEVSHLVGYYSLRYGTAGAEAAFDVLLRGQLTPLDRLLHRPQVGHDVMLGVDLAAQRAAHQALGQRRGAVVLLDIVTGEVLTLVSHPAYNPNTLDADWNALVANPDAPLLNRASQGVYAVGDLARLVGMTGLLSAGITTPLDPMGTPLDQMLAPLSQRGYLATSRQLGFDVPPPFELPTGRGLLPDFENKGSPRGLAVTPLHMARLAGAMAYDGRMPIPRLSNLPPPASNGPSPTLVSPDRAFAPGVAATLRSLTPRYDGVAGWAGVATPRETGGQPLSWFVGYAPVEAPRFAVVVVVEGDDTGLVATLPIVQETLSASVYP